MVRKTLSSFIAISLLLSFFATLPIQAQKDNKNNEEEVEHPLYNGMTVGVDLWGIGNNALGSDFISSEVAIDVNLKNRFFPTVELGYGGTDTWNDNGTHYKSSAPYFRIGMNYNAFYKKKHGNYLLVGLLYGASSFDYDVNALPISDPTHGGMIGNPNQIDDIWGGSVPFNHKMKGSMKWLEFCVGIRAHIWKQFYMGWALRFKFKASASTGENGDPWYVPGYGKYASSAMGVSYAITYKLPF